LVRRNLLEGVWCEQAAQEIRVSPVRGKDGRCSPERGTRILYARANAEQRFLLDFDLNSGFRDGELSHAEYRDLVENTLEVKRKPHLGWKPKKHHCRKVTVSQKFADAFPCPWKEFPRPTRISQMRQVNRTNTSCVICRL